MIKTCQCCGILFQAVRNMKYCLAYSYEVKLKYHRKYQRHWREANRERCRQYGRKYRADYRERYREYWRQYRYRRKLKLIREILSVKEAANSD